MVVEMFNVAESSRYFGGLTPAVEALFPPQCFPCCSAADAAALWKDPTASIHPLGSSQAVVVVGLWEDWFAVMKVGIR